MSDLPAQHARSYLVLANGPTIPSNRDAAWWINEINHSQKDGRFIEAEGSAWSILGTERLVRTWFRARDVVAISAYEKAPEEFSQRYEGDPPESVMGQGGSA